MEAGGVAALSDAAAARAELLDRLRRDGILRGTVYSRDGTTAPWMLDSLCVTLTPRGAELAGRCVLELLRRFDGRQLATLGTTGLPILQSCVLLSGGRYRGLIVRKEPKPHGARKIIEGPIDPDEPVIVVDDSVSSGLNAWECIERLEAAGLCVEGVVCLVRFGYDRGVGFLRSRGYHVESVFDIWDDFMEALGEEVLPANPTRAFEVAWGDAPAPEGLAAPALARCVIERWLETRRAPRPPARLARDHDSAGGAWVSVRSRANPYVRHARDGFWRFPEEAGDADAARDVVFAAAKTAAALAAAGLGREELDSSAIAVTFFGALERCAVGGLDDERFGIVVRSRERRGFQGGALPRMPGIGGAWAQLDHARTRNAGLLPFEAHDLFRHDVEKVVEDGARWPRTGAPPGPDEGWARDPARAGRIAERAREHVLARLRGEPTAGEPLPAGVAADDVDSVYVTVYREGAPRGCVGAPVAADLECAVAEAARGALEDARFPDGGEGEPAVVVSILSGALEVGEASPEEIAPYVIHGRQALQCAQRDRRALLLAQVAIYGDLDPAAFAWEVVDKAGIARPPYRWTRFDCTSWLCDAAGARRLEGGLPLGEPPAGLDDARRRLAPLIAAFILRQQRPDGTFYPGYVPFRNTLRDGVDAARTAHGGWVLARAGRVLGDPALVDAARRTADWLLSRAKEDERGLLWIEPPRRDPASVAEVAMALLLLVELSRDGAVAARLAATLWSSIDRHGRVATHRDPAAATDAHQDYFPGEALFALARAAEAGIAAPDGPRLERAFRFYRHRFRHHRRWGQVSWLLQALGAWHRVAGDAEHAALAHEIAAFSLEHQHRATGGFLNDHQPDGPGFTTALYLEGIAAARALAEREGKAALAARYADALDRGARFIDRLVLQERDRPLLPNPAWAIGAVRPSLLASEARADFAQHTLAALIGE